MTEANFQTNFTKWAKHHWHTSAAFELKLEKGTRMPFAAIRPHQWLCLKNAKHRNMAYKIPDTGLAPKPFDMFILSGVESYFVIMFYARGEKEFFMIDVDVLERFFESNRSLTSDDSRSLAERVGVLA